MEQKRIEFIDTCKYLAMLLVIFTHAFKEGSFIAFIFSFHLPLFFFLNGMTLKLKDQSFADFMTKKMKRYILPMLGLGILCVLLEMLIRSILNAKAPEPAFLIGLARIINQTRCYAIWFLPVLFFSDLILFGLYKKFKDNLVLIGLCTLLILGIGILFNQRHNVALVWNVDAAFFGTLFTYFGYTFRHEKLSKFYTALTQKRWVALLAGISLMVGAYFLSQYIYGLDKKHLEMFMRYYLPYHLSLPCALIGSLGFTLLCRAVTVRFLAIPVQTNLTLLAFHQIFTFPLFKYKIASQWWNQIVHLPTTDIRFITFALVLTLFSATSLTILHLILKYSPLSIFVNQPIPKFYYKKLCFKR